MQLLDKTQINNKLGVFGFWDKPGKQILIDEIRYVGGFEPLVKILGEKHEDAPVYKTLTQKDQKVSSQKKIHLLLI